MRFIVIYTDNKETMDPPDKEASLVDIETIEELIAFAEKHGKITIDDHLIGIIYTHDKK